MKLEFSRDFCEKSIQIFMTIQKHGSRVFPCGPPDGQTDITQLPVAYRNFANSPKNGYELQKISGVSSKIQRCKEY